MRSDVIAFWDAAARKGFAYAPDGKLDTWRSHAADVKAGRVWSGDCDDLASTVLDLCGLDGAEEHDRYFLVVTSINGGHAVGAIVDDEKNIWIVGDTFSDKPYRAALMKHRPHDYHRQSEGIEVWRMGVPWIVQT